VEQVIENFHEYLIVTSGDFDAEDPEVLLQT